MPGFRRRGKGLQMSSEEIVLSVKNLSKHYEIYEKPDDRLKQFIFPKIARLFGATPKKYYREFAALNNVSFDIKKGETVGIIGRNGSGKSTLLQIICGTLTSTAGLVESKGRIVALLELGSGFNPEFSGRENVRLNAMIIGLSAKQVDEKMTEILEFADIGDFIDQPVRTYSSGMFMRLAFAVQAHVDPDVLIIDEALAVGDAYFIHKCMARFHELKKSGTTILLVTHDSTAIKMLCDRGIWLSNGMLRVNGVAGNVVDAYLAEVAFMEDVVDDSKTNHKASSLENKRRKDLTPPEPTSRKGNQSVQIIGASLSMGEIIADYLKPNEEFQITLEIFNSNLGEGTNLIVGYILKNIRGIDIASGNNEIENVAIRSCKPNTSQFIIIKSQLPYLHSGEYAFTINIAYKGQSGELIYLDHCENLIRFSLVNDKECHVLMTFDAQFTSFT